jgi:hypothetical protein
VLALATSGAVLFLCYAAMALLPGLREQTRLFQPLYALAFVAYAWAIWVVLQCAPGRRTPGRRLTPLVLALAVLFRATLLLATPPTLSDDVYRYNWDGRMSVSGVNPYAHAVNSPALAHMATPLRERVNNPGMASPYLPVAQAYFGAIYRLAPESPLAFQAAAALLDLLTGLVVLALLRRVGLPGIRATIYLWNPLCVIESAHGAHVDALMVFLMMLGLWLLLTLRSRWPSVLTLAAATLTKGLPLLILPLVARRWRPWHVLAYAALLVGACLPYALCAGWGLTGPMDGVGLFGALRLYGATFAFNGGLFAGCEALLVWLLPAQADAMAGPVARGIMLAALGGVVLAAWRAGVRSVADDGVAHDGGDDLTLLRRMAVPLAAYLLLAPTLHPWYVTLVIPLLPLLPSATGNDDPATRLMWAALYGSWAVSLSYLLYLSQAYADAYPAVLLAEYLPLYALLIWAAWPRLSPGRGVKGDGTAAPPPSDA